jgi:hypothetical protein
MRFIQTMALIALLAAVAWVSAAAQRAVDVRSARGEGTTMLDFRIDLGPVRVLKASFLLVTPHR